MIGEERDVYHQQKNFRHGAIKLSKKWDKGWRTMITEKRFPNLIFRCILFASLIGFVVYIALVLESTSPEEEEQIVVPKFREELQPQQVSIPIQPPEELPQQQQPAEQKPLIPSQPYKPNQDLRFVNQKRRQAVKNVRYTFQQLFDKQAFVHAIEGYSEHAWGFDEIRPVTNETNSSWGGFGVTLFDSLDTMILMDLQDIYMKAREWVLSVNFEKDHEASFFEFNIRYVGGLLGAYELTRDRALLTKAKEMADLLMPAFGTKTGIPKSKVNLKTGESSNAKWTGSSSVLAEYASFQLEWKYLSHHLGDPIYAEKADHVNKFLSEVEQDEGLYPVYLDPETGSFKNDLVTYGGLGDSFYEYLLKQYILTGKTDSLVKDMYFEAVEGLINRLLLKSQPSGLYFIAEYRATLKKNNNFMDHLVCFVPGMLALGAPEGEHREKHMKLAEELVNTCYEMYKRQATGIGPERVSFNTEEDSKEDFKPSSTRYLLRPETVESLFVLYRATGNTTYQDWAWEIFRSIEQYCKTPSSFSGLVDVTKKDGPWNNSMQSFFFAETLKYLYLIFSDDSLLPLDEYVLTTEAHPLGVFSS